MKKRFAYFRKKSESLDYAGDNMQVKKTNSSDCDEVSKIVRNKGSFVLRA